jgi:hypothetical protein
MLLVSPNRQIIFATHPATVVRVHGVGGGGGGRIKKNQFLNHSYSRSKYTRPCLYFLFYGKMVSKTESLRLSFPCNNKLIPLSSVTGPSVNKRYSTVVVAITQQQMSRNLPPEKITLCKEEEVALTQQRMSSESLPVYGPLYRERGVHNPAVDENSLTPPPPGDEWSSVKRRKKWP